MVDGLVAKLQYQAFDLGMSSKKVKCSKLVICSYRKCQLRGLTRRLGCRYLRACLMDLWECFSLSG